MAMEIHLATLHLGAFNGTTEVPLLYVPDDAGGITVLAAKLSGPSAGTAVTGILVQMSDQGTPAIDGTIGSFTTPAVTGAGIVLGCTISDAFVDGGKWIGFDQASGTVPAGTFISLAYVMGKAG